MSDKEKTREKTPPTGGDVSFNTPFEKFEEWFSDARKSEPNDPHAMSLATVDGNGLPNVRMVLLKGHDETGFVFYTNFESQKGSEIQGNMKVAACFHWKSLRRSVRIRGPVAVVSDEEADEYFASRPRDSRIGAWASRQSRPLAGKFELEKEVARFAAKYPVGAVPRPPHWSGFRITPVSIEFWTDKPFRLHERIIYLRELDASTWRTSYLFP